MAATRWAVGYGVAVGVKGGSLSGKCGRAEEGRGDAFAIHGWAFRELLAALPVCNSTGNTITITSV